MVVFMDSQQSLLFYTQFISDIKAMYITQRVIRIFLDLRKAFDLINHNILLENMRTISIRQSLIKWFVTYLKNKSPISQQLLKTNRNTNMLMEESHKMIKLGQLRS